MNKVREVSEVLQLVVWQSEDADTGAKIFWTATETNKKLSVRFVMIIHMQ